MVIFGYHYIVCIIRICVCISTHILNHTCIIIVSCVHKQIFYILSIVVTLGFQTKQPMNNVQPLEQCLYDHEKRICLSLESFYFSKGIHFSKKITSLCINNLEIFELILFYLQILKDLYFNQPH